MDCFTLLLLGITAVDGPFHPTAGEGDMMVTARLGSIDDPFCADTIYRPLSNTDLLEGASEHIFCADGPTDAQSRLEARFDLRLDGFTITDNGWGEAIGLDQYEAFSRHTHAAAMEVRLESPVRVYVSPFMFCMGIGSVLFEIRKIGELDGPDGLFPPVISRSLGTTNETVSETGDEVFTMVPGRYRIRQASTHLAMDDITHAFARHTHSAWYVPLGDGDGSVGAKDLLALLAQFGACDQCQADVNADGQVDVGDLLQVLADWGG
ncbi:MAG: hypothetical protein MK101_11790 [Phycisphaerales bacterium]|nr:hypothetical protein [Phycisphaerales bacterium]